MSPRIRTFDRNLLRNAGSLEHRVNEVVPACWFCNELIVAETNEHVFPQWLLKELEIENEIISPIRILSDFVTIGSSRPSIPLRSLKLGKVCSNCNNGWMSQLEALTKKFLFKKNRERMSKDHAYTLARWMTKTAVCLNVSMPYRLLFSSSTRHALANAVPDNVFVFVFRARKGLGKIDWGQTSVSLWVLPDSFELSQTKLMAMTYQGNIRVGNLVGIVVCLPDWVKINDFELSSNAAQIWPPTKLPTWGGLPYLDNYLDGWVQIKWVG